VETLRRDKYLRNQFVLFKFHEPDQLKWLEMCTPMEMTPDLDQRDRVSQSVRRRVKQTGANVVISIHDVWQSAKPGIRPRFDPQRQEALSLTVEVRGGGQWATERIYSRCGQMVLISDEMPELVECNVEGRFAAWWTPTPVPSNN
jgi:hypothetical protein